MRRRWPILAGTVPLVLGWTLVTAHPAAAASVGVVQPGGPISAAAATATASPSASASPGAVPTVSPAAPGVTPQIVAGSRAAAQNQTVVQSSNWSGYAATSSGAAFTGVTATWTQPAATCTGGQQYSAFWAGLDGYSSNTVEQTGTEVDCSGTTPSYSAWYEFYPGSAVTWPTSTSAVKPNHQYTASVTYSAATGSTVTLKDDTAGWIATQAQQVAGAARFSAEVIAEAPCCTAGGGILPLTNFGTVSFTNAEVSTGASS